MRYFFWVLASYPYIIHLRFLMYIHQPWKVLNRLFQLHQQGHISGSDYDHLRRYIFAQINQTTNSEPLDSRALTILFLAGADAELSSNLGRPLDP